ncbi:MAG: PH domain-containing protein [Alphaproteobacteria bacterium]|nr:PH domain-containing protein [Alphaproteobacteria bacterium]
MTFLKRITGPDERLIGVCSAHWVYGAQGLAWLGVLAGGGMAAQVFLQDFAINHSAQPFAPVLDIIGDYTLWTALALGVLLFLFYFVIMISTEVALTSKRVIFKHGLIAVDVREVDIEEVKEAHVNNGWLGRFFNYGYIVLDARFVENLVLPAIGDPYRFIKALNEARAQGGGTSLLEDQRYDALSNNPAQEIRHVLGGDISLHREEDSLRKPVSVGAPYIQTAKRMKPVIFNKPGLAQKVKDSFHMIAHYGNKY